MNGIYILAALVFLASITPDSWVKPSAWLERIRAWFSKQAPAPVPVDGKPSPDVDVTPVNKLAGVTLPTQPDAKAALVQLQVFFATASPANRVKAFEACDMLSEALAAELKGDAARVTEKILMP